MKDKNPETGRKVIPSFTFCTRTGREDRKLGEMILYIAQKCAQDPAFGAVNLNKILYLADGISFSRYGKPITGTPYMNQEKGPVPQRLVLVQEKLKTDRHLVIEKRKVGRHIQKRSIALRPPNIKLFAARDIAIVNNVIDVLRGKSATKTSLLSHVLNYGWEFTKKGDLIPYEAFMLVRKRLTPEEINHIKELNKEHKWEKPKTSDERLA